MLQKKNLKHYYVVEGQVHLTGLPQYVRALGKRGEAGEKPIENREMRGLVQKGRNQAKDFHRKPRVQQSSGPLSTTCNI